MGLLAGSSRKRTAKIPGGHEPVSVVIAASLLTFKESAQETLQPRKAMTPKEISKYQHLKVDLSVLADRQRNESGFSPVFITMVCETTRETLSFQPLQGSRSLTHGLLTV